MTTTTKTIGGGTLTVTPKDKGFNEVPNSYALAVIKSDGSVVAWGNKDYGGDISSVADQLDGKIPVTQIYSNQMAFAALRQDGSVVTWGNDATGGDGTVYNSNLKLMPDDFEPVVTKNGSTILAIRENTVISQLDGSIPVIQIFSSNNAFAALREDGSVVSWGLFNLDKTLNDSITLYRYDSEKSIYVEDSSASSPLNGAVKIKQIYSGYGFAALRADGSVVTFGGKNIGILNTMVMDGRLEGTLKVTKVDANTIAVQWADGSLHFIQSGNSITSTVDDNSQILSNLAKSAKVVQSVDYQDMMYSQDMVGGKKASAMLLADGSVVTDDDNVYLYDSITHAEIKDYSVADKLDGSIKVTKLYSIDGITGGAFAALREDGSVITWGNAEIGGDSSVHFHDSKIKDYSVADKLNGSIKVTRIYPLQDSFVALREDGSVVGWGSVQSGSDISSITELLKNQFGGITDTELLEFANIFMTESIPEYNRWLDLIVTNGLNNSAVADKLKSGVVAVANPSTDDFYTAPIISTKPTSGNDLLTGTTKADKLSGLAGNDTLIGELGKDVLTGGKGADIFKYTSVKDSGTTAITRDTITDFKHSEKDKIDLSAIDANEKLTSDQVFKFIASKAFSKTDASGQLRFDTKSGVLYGSTDKDIDAEFSIKLNGVKSLVADDFVL